MHEGFAYYSSQSWIGGAGYDVNFALGIDGISLYMILLTTLIFPLLVLYSWNKVEHQTRMFYILLMVMETAILGFFMALDMLAFYVFFELVLIPAIFFIGIWGSDKRRAATLKFFLYTLAGSLLMLIAIIYMGLQAQPGVFTTNYFTLQDAGFAPDAQRFLFLAFAIGFAIKAPIFPLHTWQADAYAESSTTGTIIMAAILSKMGVYGLIRFCMPLFPESFEAFSPVIAFLGVVGIVYGAMAAFAQDDMKRLLAYSSLSHIGFIVLGLFALNSAEAISGSVLQMLAHGISTAALFFLVGMMEDRQGSRLISDYEGIAKQLPVYAFLFVLSIMASVGLPGLSGFVGEFMIMVGAFGSDLSGGGILTIFAATGVIIAGVYLLTLTRKYLFGKAIKAPNSASLRDLGGREVGLLIPLVILMFWIGLNATPFLKPIDQSVADMLRAEQVPVEQIEVETPTEPEPEPEAMIR
jgi:NADH-quinone oxidoreductase subunit M